MLVQVCIPLVSSQVFNLGPAMYLPHGVQVWIPHRSSQVSNPGLAMNLPHAGPGLDPAWFQTSFQPWSSNGFTSCRSRSGFQPGSSYKFTSCGSRSGSRLVPDKFPTLDQLWISLMQIQVWISARVQLSFQFWSSYELLVQVWIPSGSSQVYSPGPAMN